MHFLKRKIFKIALIVLLYDVATAAHACAATNIQKSMSVDDVLNLELVLNAIVDPTGKRIALLHLPPYKATYETLGGDWYGTILVGERSPTGGLKTEPLLPELLGQSQSTIIGFSPSGRRLAFYWGSSGAKPVFRIGVYDFVSKNLFWMPGQGYYRTMLASPVWLTDDLFVYNSNAEGDETLPMPDRAADEMLRLLVNGWEKKKKGTETTAVVAYSAREDRLQETAHCGRGQLMLFNFASGTNRRIADRPIVDLKPVGDGAYLTGSMFCGDKSLVGSPATNKTARQWIRPVLIAPNDKNAIKLVCKNCSIVHGSMHVSPDRNELAFFSNWKSVRPEDAKLIRYRISTGEASEYSLSKILPVSLDVRVDFTEPSPIVWLDKSLAVYSAPLGDVIDDAGRPLARAVEEIRKDWYLIEGDGRVSNLTKAMANVSPMPLLADGRFLYFVEGNEIVSITAAGRLSRKEIKGAQRLMSVQETLSSANRFSQSFETAVQTDSLLILADDVSGRKLMSWDHEKGASETLVAVPSGYDLLSFTPGGPIAIWQTEKDKVKTLSFTFGADGRQLKPTPFLTLNTHLENVELPKKIRLPYNGPDGREYFACLLVPASHPNGPLPLIVDVYPFVRSGNCASEDFATWHNPFLWSGQGYAYMFAGPAVGLRDPRTGEANDLAEWIDSAVDKAIREGYADPERLVLQGISQGSFLALNLLTKSRRFKAAIVAHGAANYASLWGDSGFAATTLWFDKFPPASAMNRFEDPTSFLWLGGTPWEVPDRYIEATPLFSADKIVTPLMFIHTDADGFPLAHFVELYSALYRQDKEVSMVYYRGEEHSLASPANIKDAVDRVTNWLKTYLK